MVKGSCYEYDSIEQLGTAKQCIGFQDGWHDVNF